MGQEHDVGRTLLSPQSWKDSRSLEELAERYRPQFEEVLEPDLPIVDAHHHLWHRPGARYLIDEFLADIRSGHNIVATVYVEGMTMWHTGGPEPMRPVGETEFAVRLAVAADNDRSSRVEVNAAIVAYANLRLGDAVGAVIEAHMAAGQGRVRGMRDRAQYDSSIGDLGSIIAPPHLMQDTDFRKGLGHVAAAGIVYDAWQFHPQIPEVTELARAVPAATIVLDHMGGILGVEVYAGRRQEIFNHWRKDMRELAQCPNVYVKLGGLGMPMSGFGYNTQLTPPSSATLAPLWAPYIESCIDLFGVKRCMFQSNFPADKQSSSYSVLWNTFKKITSAYSNDEKLALYFSTAQKIYGL